VFADASLIEAHAPPAIERDTPANPNAGKALLRRFVFEERFDMAQFSRLFGHIGPIDTVTLRSVQTLAQVSKKLWFKSASAAPCPARRPHQRGSDRLAPSATARGGAVPAAVSGRHA
jgi:hypothetical protein